MSSHDIEWIVVLVIALVIACSGGSLKRKVRKEREADERRAREKGEPYVAELHPPAC
jgi:hypothetical protein